MSVLSVEQPSMFHEHMNVSEMSTCVTVPHFCQRLVFNNKKFVYKLKLINFGFFIWSLTVKGITMFLIDSKKECYFLNLNIFLTITHNLTFPHAKD